MTKRYDPRPLVPHRVRLTQVLDQPFVLLLLDRLVAMEIYVRAVTGGRKDPKHTGDLKSERPLIGRCKTITM